MTLGSRNSLQTHSKASIHPEFGRRKQHCVSICIPSQLLYMLSSHCFQLSAHYNATDLMFSNYRNVTGQVEKFFSSPASLPRRKTKAPGTFCQSATYYHCHSCHIYDSVLLHPTRAELITAALSRECQKASEENVNQRLKYKQTKLLEGKSRHGCRVLRPCIATHKREGGLYFPGSALDHSGLQRRKGGGKSDFYGVFHFSCEGVSWGGVFHAHAPVGFFSHVVKSQASLL